MEVFCRCACLCAVLITVLLASVLVLFDFKSLLCLPAIVSHILTSTALEETCYQLDVGGIWDFKHGVLDGGNYSSVSCLEQAGLWFIGSSLDSHFSHKASELPCNAHRSWSNKTPFKMSSAALQIQLINPRDLEVPGGQAFAIWPLVLPYSLGDELALWVCCLMVAIEASTSMRVERGTQGLGNVFPLVQCLQLFRTWSLGKKVGMETLQGPAL